MCDKHEEIEFDCKDCERDWKQSAYDAGIPWSVIEGKTKLSDHFSEEYIKYSCNPKEYDDDKENKEEP